VATAVRVNGMIGHTATAAMGPNGGAGGSAGSVQVTQYAGNLSLSGTNSHGILALSLGGDGGNGGDGLGRGWTAIAAEVAAGGSGGAVSALQNWRHDQHFE